MHFRHEGSDRLSTIELAEAALNSQLDTFFVFEPDSGKAVYWNKAFRDTSGYTDEEIAGLPAPVSYYDSDTLQRIKNCMQENSTTGVLDIDAHFICKDGSRIHTEYRASYITDDENKPKYIVSIGRDITERKQAEEEPGMGETFSDSLVNTAQVIILVLNPDATIRFINPYMENLSGYTLAEVKGRDWFNTFLPDGDWSEIREVLRKTISDLNTIVHINPIITKDGRERFIEWHNQALRDRKSQVVGVLATGQNITERRDVEIKLKQSEERNNFAQAVGHVGTWDWNVITDEVIWSDETYRILGFFPGECMPSIELFMNLVHIDDRERISHAIESALNHNQAYNVDCRIIRKDGSECIANAQGEVLLNQDARPLQMRGTFQDISARKHLEEQLAQSQKMEAIGTLVGGIAHDFNNMLAGMTGNLYLAKEHVSEMPDVVDHLDHIEDIAFRAADMIQQLLTFARKSMVNIKPMPLNPYINETIKLLRTSVPENIELHQEVCSDALQINGDTTQLHQVLLNLVNNARDAVEDVDHPIVSIKLESFQPDGAIIASHASFKDLVYAHLSVEDNGCGIPEQQLEHLFEPFFTTKAQGKGTGLGLSMAFGAIKMHHGFIEVESIEGKGSTFHVYIPLSLQVEKIALTPPEEKEIARGHGEVILFVDDQLPIIETGKAVLESLGYRVLTASDGRQAIDIFKAHVEEIELCILDVVMPGMGGDKTAQCIRQAKPGMKVIFTTGYGKSILTGMENEVVLCKPFRIKEVSHLIRMQLDS